MSRIEEALRKAEELERQKRGDVSLAPLSDAGREAAPPLDSPAKAVEAAETSVVREIPVKPSSPPPPSAAAGDVAGKSQRSARGYRSRSAKRSARIRDLFDKIRANIILALPEQDCRLLAMCSSLRGEGTTTMAVHLALSMAEQGPTLLVDANTLNPELHRYFQVTGRPGLSECLAQEVSFDEAICGTTNPHLFVCIMGALRSETSAQLCGAPMRRFLELAADRFTTVILDCAALEAAAETPLMAAMTDGAVLVVRAGRTRREIVQHSSEIIHNANARCVGVVLNQMKFPIPSVLYDRL